MANTDKRNKERDINTLKWIYNTCKKHLWRVLVLTLIHGSSSVLSILFALTCREVIDSAISKNSQHLTYSVITLFCIIVGQLLINLISKNISERIKNKINLEIRLKTFSNMLKKDYERLSSHHSGDLQLRIFNDTSVVSNGVTNMIPNVVSLCVRLLLAFAVLVSYDRIFATVFLVAGVLVVVSATAFRKFLKSSHKKVQESEGKARSFIQESIENILMIKAFGGEEKITQKTDELQKINFRLLIKRVTVSLCAHTGAAFVFRMGYLFALVWSAYNVFAGVITPGTITAIIQLVNQIQNPFSSFSNMIPQYYSILASAERVMEIENIPDEPMLPESDFDADKVYADLESIEFDNITFSYSRGDSIIEDSSLSVKKGDFVAIMGISGIGKSTLLKLLLGVFNTQSGEIYLNTKDGKILADKHTRPLFSYVPQGNFLLSGTIRENITFLCKDVSEDKINEAIRMSCSEEFVKNLDDGLDTVIGERGLGLSEGQVQRLAVARALLSGSPVLLLDESTSALDEATEAQLLENLKNSKDITCIIVTHKKAALDICNRHIQINDKKIVSEG